MNDSKAFLRHVFSDSESLWLAEAASSRPFDPKVVRIKLKAEVPITFNPSSIDQRFYQDNRLTILGIRLFRPEDEIFRAMNAIVLAIRKKICSEPGLEFIGIESLEGDTPHSRKVISHGIKFLYEFTNMFTGISHDGDQMPTGVWLSGPHGYDKVLAYIDIDSSLEDWYQLCKPRSFNWSMDNLNVTNSKFDQSPAVDTKPGTAFVIMPIDPNRPELEDTLEAIKSACNSFSIKAYRADEIEHQDVITDMILDQIRSCEFLIADLSDERPNVYYEIGYAHALNKRPILYRRKGTKLHFDLAIHNVPEYKNATELRTLLQKRLEAILGRQAAPSAKN